MRTWGARRHNLWRTYSGVTTRCRGTVAPTSDSGKARRGPLRARDLGPPGRGRDTPVVVGKTRVDPHILWSVVRRSPGVSPACRARFRPPPRRRNAPIGLERHGALPPPLDSSGSMEPEGPGEPRGSPHPSGPAGAPTPAASVPGIGPRRRTTTDDGRTSFYSCGSPPRDVEPHGTGAVRGTTSPCIPVDGGTPWGGAVRRNTSPNQRDVERREAGVGRRSPSAGTRLEMANHVGVEPHEALRLAWLPRRRGSGLSAVAGDGVAGSGA